MVLRFCKTYHKIHLYLFSAAYTHIANIWEYLPTVPREGDLKNFVHKMNQIFLVSCMTLCVWKGGRGEYTASTRGRGRYSCIQSFHCLIFVSSGIWFQWNNCCCCCFFLQSLFSDPGYGETDQISRVRREVDEVKDVMTQNIGTACWADCVSRLA